MELFQLKIFVSLANTLNYKKTAEANHITQPAVSYHIKNLESELQVQLFERNKYRTSLTEAGIEFLHFAELICEQEYLAKERILSIASGKTGRITVAGVQTYLEQISTISEAFMKAFPEVRMDINILDGPDLLRSHMFAEFDVYFGVKNMISGNESYQDRHILDEYMELYYPAHLEDSIQMDDWNSLSSIPFISVVEKNSLLHNRVGSIMKDFMFTPNVIHHATSIESILTLVDAGCGISILPAGHTRSTKYPQTRSRQIIHKDSLLPLIISCRRDRNQSIINKFMDVVNTILRGNETSSFLQ